MSQKIYQVDSFTAERFGGNPAGVCILGEAAQVEWMHNVAAEMNLSETAFIYPEKDGYNLRWFTPTTEVDLCGHATLATAHILWEEGVVERDRPAKFYTASGLLTAELADDWIKLDFPAQPPEPAEPPPGLLEAIGVKAVYVGWNKSRYLIEVESEEIVRKLSPDIAALLKAGGGCVIITSRSGGGQYDFISRFFAPGMGIDEDPVTGAAHCCLGPYWKDQLGKTELMAYQASSRGGELKVKVAGDRVHLYGQAVTVFEAVLK